MRRLFVQTNTSLDGYITDGDGEIDWHFADDEFSGFIDDTLRSIGAMVFGRVAFEQLAGYWPGAGDDVSPVQVRRMHELPKYVLTHGAPPLDWHNSHVLVGDPATALAGLKQQDGGDIALFAGGRAASAALGMGVVDELRLVVNPALLGGGTPMFAGDYARSELELADVRRFASGALVLRYVLAGR